MNERIKQLMEQAIETVDDPFPGNPLNEELAKMYIPDCFAEKFAELIVRDCIAIVEPSSYRRAYPDNYRGGIDCMDTLDDRVEKIKEHFGVKE